MLKPLQVQKQALLRKQMDGPVVPWTVGDAVRQVGGNNIFMVYHATVTPWSLFTPIGCLLGAGWYGLMGSKTSSTLLGSMASGGLIMGGLGVTLGLGLRTNLALQGEAAVTKTGIPWNEDGIQQRVDGLSHNFKVRVMDLSAWNGAAAAVASMVVAGVTPVSMGLAPGALGMVQAVTLGSSLGSVAGLSCIYSTEVAASKALDADTKETDSSS